MAESKAAEAAASSPDSPRRPSSRRFLAGAIPVLPLLDPRSPPQISGSASEAAENVVNLVAEHEDTPAREPPPSYHEAEGASANPAEPSAALVERRMGMKLKHKDFLPQPVGTKGEEFETFVPPMQRANLWLKENRDAEFCTCETITWTVADKAELYTDNMLNFKSMADNRRNRIMRGLRIWYWAYGDQFWVESPHPPVTIGYRNFHPENPKTITTTVLLKLMNENLKKGPLPGKILKVETLHILTDLKDPNLSSWKESPENDRKYYSFLRLWYVDTGEETWNFYTVGLKDFVPEYNQRTQLNKGYETMSELYRRAAKWVFQETALHYISVQSFCVKRKKDYQVTDVWSRLQFMEHGSANGALSEKPTEYMRILRVAYFSYTSPPPSRLDKPITPARLSYHTVSPAFSGFLPHEKGKDLEISETSYEDLRATADKLSIWIAASGAKLLDVETNHVRLKSGGQEALGPETTFLFNGREKQLTKEPWLSHVRLFLEGDYVPVPYLGGMSSHDNRARLGSVSNVV